MTLPKRLSSALRRLAGANVLSPPLRAATLAMAVMGAVGIVDRFLTLSMTPRERVRRAGRRLARAIVLSAALWAATLAMAVVIAVGIVDHFLTLSGTARVAIMPLAALAAGTAAAVVLWRGRGARSIEGVALWVEEQDPGLRYALATAIEPDNAPAVAHPDLHRIASAADVEGIVRRAGGRALGRSLTGFLVVGGVLVLLHPTGLLRGAEAALASGSYKRGAAAKNRLAGISALVVPPDYSRLPARTLRDPSDVASLIGSKVTFMGNGPPDGLKAALDSTSYTAHANGARDGEQATGGWAVDVTMPRTPAVVALQDLPDRRLVTLDPITDSAPDVRLLLPLHDTTYQAVPREPLAISAALSDDIGLHYGYVEYVITAGGGENFQTKVVNGVLVEYDNARAGTLGAIVRLDTMKLGPGDVVHVRVVAYDYNDVTGPGVGVSETRTLRVAEPVDSTSINPAPPLPIDSMWISQRLLNMKTDTLIRTQRGYTREVFDSTSSDYSNVQEAIRQKALAVIGLIEQTGEGSDFQTEVSTKLREVVELMWTAREDLGIALPDTAMPYMIRILKMLDELRLANRYYLRGILRPVPVDVSRVRLAGKEPARVDERLPRSALGDPAAVLAARLDIAAALARTAPGAAADSLVYIRVTALGASRAVPSAVAQELLRAIDLLREGARADSALARARLALQPPTRFLSGPLEWGGVVP